MVKNHTSFISLGDVQMGDIYITKIIYDKTITLGLKFIIVGLLCVPTAAVDPDQTEKCTLVCSP